MGLEKRATDQKTPTSNYLIIGFLGLLGLCTVSLILREEAFAQSLANWAFLLLAVGVAVRLIEMRTGSDPVGNAARRIYHRLRHPSFAQPFWRAPIAVILVLYLVLGIWYSVAIPLGEAYDEWAHYRYVEYIATHHALPPPDLQLTVGLSETHQPPLYYLAAGLATSWIHIEESPEPDYNPYVSTTSQGGQNVFVNIPDASFPYHGRALMFHIARLVSVAMGTVTVLFTYRIALLIFPGKRELALGAAAVNAFMPQFLFMGSVINNDIAVGMFGSIILFYLLRIVLRKATAFDVVALWLATLLGLLAKYHGFALLPLTLGGSVLALRQGLVRKSTARILVPGAFLSLGAVLLLFWWDLRNRSHVAQPTPLVQEFSGILGFISHPVSAFSRLNWSLVPETLRFSFETFWASFGWGNISADPWVYQLLLAVCAAASIGLAIYLLNKRNSSTSKLALVTLGTSIILMVGLTTYFVLQNGFVPAAAGRRLLPAVSAVSVLLMVGLAELVPKARVRHLAASIGMAMLLFALVVPFRYIMPVYARPITLSESALQNLGHPLEVRYGDDITLMRYEVDKSTVRQGETLPVTLYWKTQAKINADYTVAVKVMGADGNIYGQVHSYPGRGTYPTSQWKPGNVIRDTYEVPIKTDVPYSMAAKVLVALFLQPDLKHLPVFDPNGQPMDNAVQFGHLKLAASETPSYLPDNSVAYNLGDSITLVGYTLSKPTLNPGESLLLKLYWGKTKDTGEDYTVFVHLSDDQEHIRAQDDAEPVQGSYPTSLWDKGEVVEDAHALTLARDMPLGQYRLFVGMYVQDSKERLAVTDEHGVRLADDRILLETVRVVEP